MTDRKLAFTFENLNHVLVSRTIMIGTSYIPASGSDVSSRTFKDLLLSVVEAISQDVATFYHSQY